MIALFIFAIITTMATLHWICNLFFVFGNIYE
ncbi:hypothetical protein [Candidatus Coxiella mudrowiae]